MDHSTGPVCSISGLKEYQESGRDVRYMLYGSGKVHSAPHSSGRTNYQLNFIADKIIRRSVITLTMEADTLKYIIAL